MKSKILDPISKLKPKLAFLWWVCLIGGALLAAFSAHPFTELSGKLLWSMCIGYLIFGFGIKTN